MNKVFLIGNLTKDPETSTTTSGIKVCKFLKHPVEGPGAADCIAPSRQMPFHGSGNNLIVLYHKNTIHSPTSLIGESVSSCGIIVNDVGPQHGPL